MSTHKINLKAELKRAWEIVLLKKPTMHHVAEGGKAETTFGYYMIVAAAILSIVGQQLFVSFFKPSLVQSLVNGVMQVIMAVVGIYILSYVAHFFKGKAKHDAFFRVMAYAFLVAWLGIVPALGLIGFIWIVILTFVILKAVHKLSTGGAIGTMFISLIASMVVGVILGMITGGLFGTRFGGSFDYKSSGSRFNINIPSTDNYDGGSIKFDGGKMIIEGADGEKIEIEVPQ